MQFKLISAGLLLAITAIGCKNAQQKETMQQVYQAVDLTADSSFTKGAEGPAVDKEGNIYAVNFSKEGTIGIVTPAGSGRVFVELPNGSVGNGIRFNSKGEMLIADYTNHNILKVEMTGANTISVYAHDSTMSQPNDIAIDSKDRLFASDPNWKAGTGRIWRIDTDGKVNLLEDSMGTTNGIEVSPDEKILYVNESVQRNVWAYDLSPGGEISNKRLLISFPDFGMDGMRCDVAGNLYITRHGKGVVAMVSPEGKLIREITLKGKLPSNIAFGGPEGKTAYVTLQDRGNMEQFSVETPGREWKKK
ncbi:SMP-30/gluconolactonase/LRE family protein [Flavihumibacter fluvii]|uniref:SMP-30/gluconolactonase/LRE family protein n=1 Tax=Flavihumibacter fluvii TaxID=2838157 RepID=UPI001BDDCE4F|nr:SMP-30/gluconolactonase/LRE family protein [Flavihumibacter fluvii]ULQ50730.1 SMP-30/gluconolactonase/LRE family protein [Flavihumibacter fluvii]